MKNISIIKKFVKAMGNEYSVKAGYDKELKKLYIISGNNSIMELFNITFSEIDRIELEQFARNSVEYMDPGYIRRYIIDQNVENYSHLETYAETAEKLAVYSKSLEKRDYTSPAIFNKICRNKKTGIVSFTNKRTGTIIGDYVTQLEINDKDTDINNGKMREKENYIIDMSFSDFGMKAKTSAFITTFFYRDLSKNTIQRTEFTLKSGNYCVIHQEILKERYFDLFEVIPGDFYTEFYPCEEGADSLRQRIMLNVDPKNAVKQLKTLLPYAEKSFFVVYFDYQNQKIFSRIKNEDTGIVIAEKSIEFSDFFQYYNMSTIADMKELNTRRNRGEPVGYNIDFLMNGFDIIQTEKNDTCLWNTECKGGMLFLVNFPVLQVIMSVVK